MKSKKLTFIALLSALLIFTVCICAGAEDKPLPQITVATNAEIKPFSYIDENNNLCGIDIEIMNELCAIMEAEPVYSNYNFDAMIPCVRSSLADCAISAIVATDSRKKVVDFTDSYLDCKIYNPNIDKWFEESYSIAVKLSGEYKDQLNNAISQLKDSGKIDEIAKKYGLTQDPEGRYTYSLPKEENAPAKEAYTVSPWAEASVKNAIDARWSTPSDFKNNYTANITREQFCEIAYNMMRDAYEVGTVNIADVSFEDTQNTKVLYLAQEGIISGKGNGLFAPKDYLTREEAASILYRIARYSGLNINKYEGAPFEDDALISDWAKTNVYMVLSAGIMTGTGEGFSPKGIYTAEQAISTIERLYNSIK